MAADYSDLPVERGRRPATCSTLLVTEGRRAEHAHLLGGAS